MKVFGKTLTLVLTALIVSSFCFMAPALAGDHGCEGCEGCDDCKSSGKIFADTRYRTTWSGLDFNGDTQMDNQQWLRTRVGMKFMQKDMKAFVQFQYPFLFNNPSGSASPNATGGVHQAYIKYMGFYMDNLAAKAGRFEMKYGDERLIGAVGWNNTGRTFDGLKFHYDTDAFWCDYFLTTQSENGGGNTNAKDNMFTGVWAEIKSLKLNVFYLMQRNALNSADGNSWNTNLSRSTIGIHYMNQYESGLGALVDFAMQMGTTGIAPGDNDISARMIVAAVWYKFTDMAMSPAIGAGIDMTTGDDPTTPENEGFSNLYYTGHKWRGAMDYFVADNFMGGTNPGLTDIMVKAYVHPWETGMVGLAFHMFSTEQDFAAAGGGTSTSLGNEIDIFYKNDYNDRITAEAGLSMFMPNEDWQGSNADNSMWIYMQLSSKFDAFAWGK